MFLKSLTQNLAYVGIVHVGESLEDLAPLVLGPHHECIHWPFNVGLVVVSSPRFPEDSRLGRSSASCWPTTIIGLGFICRAIDFLGPRKKQGQEQEERAWRDIKWQAMFKLSFICYLHHDKYFKWVQRCKHCSTESTGLNMAFKVDLISLNQAYPKAVQREQGEALWLQE